MNRTLDVLEKIKTMTIEDFVAKSSHTELVSDDLIGSKNGSIIRFEAGFVDENGIEIHFELNITDNGI